MKRSYLGIRPALIELASRPQDVDAAEFVAAHPGWTNEQFYENGCKMVKHGMLLTVGMRHFRRLFSKAEDAERYAREGLLQAKAKAARAWQERENQLEREQRAAMRKDKPAKPPVRVVRAKKTKPPKDAPVKVKHYGRAPWGPETPAIIPPHVKITICPSPSALGLAAKVEGLR
jgi:hypothetical protein